MPRQTDQNSAVDTPTPTMKAKAARPTLRARFKRRGPTVPLAATLVVLLVLFGLALLILRPASSGRSLSLDQTISAATEGRLKTARFLDEDARITGTVVLTPGRPPVQFWTSYPRSDAATNDLLRTFFAAGTHVTVDSQAGKAMVRFLAQFLLPLVILADLFALLFYLARSPGDAGEFQTFSRLGNRQLGSGEKSRVTFADIAAAEEPVIELSEVRDYLADPSVFRRMGALPPKGILLVGPPGCGKTLLARAVAGEANANFFSISGSEFVESLVGVGAARVRDLFRQAQAVAPAILFIDELDAVGRQRGAGLGGGHDEREQTLNELLVQMDGFSPTAGVAVLAATNRIDILDPALLRPGRFDRQITVERPDVEGRLAILRLHARGKRLADPEVELPGIARQTPGFTGADLAAVLNEAALLAVRERADAVGRQHLDEAVERVVGGPRTKAVILSIADRRRIAYHEGGHAVVAAALGQADAAHRISIVSRGRGIGHLAMLSEDNLLPTRMDMEVRVAIALAGGAAEEIVLGQASIGSEVDLERATNTARDMAGRFGMSAHLGKVRVLREHQEVFLGRDYLLARDVSQPTLEHLDVEVRRILDEQEQLARSILYAHLPVLDGLAQNLLTQETVEGSDLDQYLRAVQLYPRPEPDSAPARS